MTKVWRKVLNKDLTWVVGAVTVDMTVRSRVKCEIGRWPSLEELPVKCETTWMVWFVASPLLLVAWTILVAVYKWVFFGLPEESAFLSRGLTEEKSPRVKGAKPNKTPAKWIDAKLEGLRIRYPEKSRVQRLYLNKNTVTIGVILTLCTAIRVQLVVIHVMLDSLTKLYTPRRVCLSFLDHVVVALPGHLIHPFPITMLCQLFLRTSLFFFVGSIVQWKKNDTAVRKRLKQSSMRVQKRAKKTK